MSYSKIRSICITDKDVFLTAATNNVRPLTYDRESYPYFVKILKEEGREAVEIALLKSYEEGNLQGGKNKFTRALKVLRYIFNEEYLKFSWRDKPWKQSEEKDKEHRELRDSQEFKDFLKKCLDYKIPKRTFVITKEVYGEKAYGKLCPTCMKWSRFKEDATKFDFEAEAQDYIYSSYKDEWRVLEL